MILDQVKKALQYFNDISKICSNSDYPQANLNFVYNENSDFLLSVKICQIEDYLRIFDFCLDNEVNSSSLNINDILALYVLKNSGTLEQTKKILGDDLTWLFLDALKLIKKIIELGGIVDWIMWENAPYFISNKQDAVITDRLGGKTILQHITDELEQYSFHVHAKILDASHYDTAQARKRGIILCRRGQVWDFPTPDDKQLYKYHRLFDRNVG